MHMGMFFCTKEKMPWVLVILSIFHAEISSGTPSVQVLLGSNASFSFLLSQEPNVSVVTILDKDGTVVMNARGSLGISSNPIYNYRINFTGNTYQKLISFILRNVTLADAGMYIAVVSFPDKTIGSQMLIVKASPSKPQIVELSGPGVTGSDYSLNCSAQSNSEPPRHNLSMFSEWRRDDIPIISSRNYIVMGTELTITGLSYIQDNGARLTCVAFEDQLAKSVSSDEFIVDVIYGPAGVQISLSPSEFPLEVEENKTVNIACSADCNPGCTFTWSGPQE